MNTITPQQFGTRVKEVRMALAFTQKEMAEAIGCRQSDLSRLENGLSIQHHKLVAILAWLATQVNLNVLFSDQYLVADRQQIISTRLNINSAAKARLLQLQDDITRQIALINTLL